MLKLIDKYILNQVFASTLGAIVLFTLIWIAPETLFEIIQNLITHKITFFEATKRFCYEIPLILGRLMPFGLLLGCLFTFDKLSRDSELTIFRSIGVSMIRIIRPIVFLSVILACLCFYTYDTLIPFSRVELNKMEGSIRNLHLVYMQKDKSGKPEQIIIMPQYDGKYVYNPSVLQLKNSPNVDEPLMSHIYTAPKGLISENQITIIEGNDYVISDQGVYEEINPFDYKIVAKGEMPAKVMKLLSFQSEKARNLTNAQLKEYIQLLKDEGLVDEFLYMKNKLYQRFFHALNCVFLAICGVALGYSRPREQRILGFTMGAGIMFLYFITIPFLDVLAQKAVLPPMICAMLPSILIALTTHLVMKSKQI